MHATPTLSTPIPQMTRTVPNNPENPAHEAQAKAAANAVLAPLVDPAANLNSPNSWRYPASIEGPREGDISIGPYAYGDTEEYWTVTMNKDPDATFVDVLAAMVGPNGPFALPRESLEQLNQQINWIRMQALWKLRMDQELGREISRADVMRAMFTGIPPGELEDGN